MPKILADADLDPIVDAVDQEILESGREAEIPKHVVNLNSNFGDLSDGGMVGRARVTPVGSSGRVIFDKKRAEPGRPTVRQVWTWDGRPSTIPLAYEPSGKRHDGGRRYLLKRHCVTCNYTGFYGEVCPACLKDGRKSAPVVQAFYRTLDEVPKRQRFFGNVDCFVPACVRRGPYGFLDDAQMRQHAIGRHRAEYRAFQDSQLSRNDQELAVLREQVAALVAATVHRPKLNEEQQQRMRERMMKARAAKKGYQEVHHPVETSA